MIIKTVETWNFTTFYFQRSTSQTWNKTCSSISRNCCRFWTFWILSFFDKWYLHILVFIICHGIRWIPNIWEFVHSGVSKQDLVKLELNLFSEVNFLLRRHKGERTLDLWGTLILLKSFDFNRIISRFLQIGTIAYCAWMITFLDASASLQPALSLGYHSSLISQYFGNYYSDLPF